MRSLDASTPSGAGSLAPPRRRRLRVRIGRWLLIALAVLVGLVGTGMLYQAIATALDRRSFTPAGQMVDLGGYRLHLHCTGAGAPTVVLESGAGAPTSVWAWVQPAVAQQTRVCSYDRAGLGWSDSSPHPRDAASVARELHMLLTRAGETGPFVVAGHSLGGQYALMFAEQYRQETAGIVLIEAQHPDTTFRLPAAQAVQRKQEQQISMLIVLSRIGIVRLLNMAPADDRLPAEAQAAMNMTKNSTAIVTAIQAELLEIPTNRQQLHGSGDLGSTPLTVVSATEHGMTPELESYTAGLQRELVALSTKSHHDIVAGADHSSLATDQNDAQHTVAAIGAVVEQVRDD